MASAVLVVVLALVLAPLSAGGGCDSEAATDEFRAVAADGVAAGLQSILSALVDGVFAVVEPNPDEGDDAAQ